VDCKPSPAAAEKLMIDSGVACEPPISATSRPWNAHGAAENAARPARPPIQLHLRLSRAIEPVLTEASHLMERLAREAAARDFEGP
jgi:hypothetical protein